MKQAITTVMIFSKISGGVGPTLKPTGIIVLIVVWCQSEGNLKKMEPVLCLTTFEYGPSFS